MNHFIHHHPLTGIMRICSNKHFFILFPILIADFLSLTIAQITTCIDGGGNYTNNSTYQSNLKALVSHMPSQIDDYGFGNFSFGQDPDTTFGLTLCRGDVEINDCRSCVREVMANVTRICGNHKEAVGWVESCTVRYSSRSLYDKVSYDAYWCGYLVRNATDQDKFNTNLETLLGGLRVKAASGGLHKKYATDNVTAFDLETIRGLMQCTPDLSEKECSECLLTLVGWISSRCSPGKMGMKMFCASCTFRYEAYSFYSDPTGPEDITPPLMPQTLAPPPTPPRGTGTNTTGKGKSKIQMITIIVAASIASIILFTACICLFLRKRKLRKTVQKAETGDQIKSSTVDDIKMVESLQFDFNIVATATDNFSNTNKLGTGGFGVVYKGVLPDGVEIAVKRLSENSLQGEVEFKNEVVLVAKLQHRNLVRLLGFSYKQNERLLIYELMTNSSLDRFIFDPVKSTILSWDKRYKIIGGIARGLLYLHEDSRLRIIHRDLKASNILLDDEMNPKISDFGMARLFVMDETHGSTRIIAGTYGYMAPEYARHGHFSVKSDIFSFGVLILEIVSGEKNSNFKKGETGEDLLSFTWNSWRNGRALDVVDHSLMSTMNSTREIMRYIHIGLLCVHEKPVDRPTMAQVVLMLTSMSLTLPVPSQPAYFQHSNVSHEMPLLWDHDSKLTDRSKDSRYKIVHSSDNEASLNEASITEPYPR